MVKTNGWGGFPSFVFTYSSEIEWDFEIIKIELPFRSQKKYNVEIVNEKTWASKLKCLNIEIKLPWSNFNRTFDLQKNSSGKY